MVKNNSLLIVMVYMVTHFSKVLLKLVKFEDDKL